MAFVKSIGALLFCHQEKSCVLCLHCLVGLPVLACADYVGGAWVPLDSHQEEYVRLAARRENCMLLMESHGEISAMLLWTTSSLQQVGLPAERSVRKNGTKNKMEDVI